MYPIVTPSKRTRGIRCGISSMACGKRCGSAARKFTIEEATELALDEKWGATELWLAALRKAEQRNEAASASWNSEQKEFLAAILAFDGHARADSSKALKYFLWRQEIFKQLPEDRIRAVVREQWAGKLDAAVSEDDATVKKWLTTLNRVPL